MQSQIKITNLTSSDLDEMLTVASPDEVYSFVAYNLVVHAETESKARQLKALKLQWVAHKTKSLLSH